MFGLKPTEKNRSEFSENLHLSLSSISEACLDHLLEAEVADGRISSEKASEAADVNCRRFTALLKGSRHELYQLRENGDRTVLVCAPGIRAGNHAAATRLKSRLAFDKIVIRLSKAAFMG